MNSIISHCMYVSSATCIPNYVAKNISKFKISFTWKGKKSKLSQNIVDRNKSNIRLDVPNINV